MDDFLARYGLSILIALAILGVLIAAEWNDRRHEIEDGDDLGALEEYSPYLVGRDRDRDSDVRRYQLARDDEEQPRYVSAYANRSSEVTDEVDEDDGLFSEKTRREAGLTPAASPPRFASHYR